MPSRIGLRYLNGIVFSSQKMIGFFGGESVGFGIGLLQIPAIDVPHEAIVGRSFCEKSLIDRQKVTDAIVGQPRLVTGTRQFADRIVDVDRRPAAVGDRFDILVPLDAYVAAT